MIRWKIGEKKKLKRPTSVPYDWLWKRKKIKWILRNEKKTVDRCRLTIAVWSSRQQQQQQKQRQQQSVLNCQLWLFCQEKKIINFGMKFWRRIEKQKQFNFVVLVSRKNFRFRFPKCIFLTILTTTITKLQWRWEKTQILVNISFFFIIIFLKKFT